MWYCGMIARTVFGMVCLHFAILRFITVCEHTEKAMAFSTLTISRYIFLGLFPVLCYTRTV